jgi:hypothetical protein
MENIRSFKVFNIAVADVVGTVVIAVYISDQYNYPRSQGVALAFLLGIATHKLLGINTQLNYDLGLSERPTRSTNS